MLLLLCCTVALLVSTLDNAYCIEEIRIDGSLYSRSPNLGIIRALNNGKWGFICDNEGWPLEGDNVAIVTCNQLGYRGSNHKSVTFPYDWLVMLQDAIWLHGVSCVGNETSLAECLLGDWNVIDQCFSLAGVICDDNEDHLDVQLVDGTADNPAKGVLQVLYNGVWSTICPHNFDFPDDAITVMCRQLGYSGEHQRNIFAHPITGDIFLIRDGIVCEGSESNLDQCASSEQWDLDFSTCDNPIEIECGNCAIEDVRLTNDTSEDLVEVLYQGDDCPGKWVHLCSQYVDFPGFQYDVVAGVFCGQLGYQE
ncbi:egg peptide speract receptor-like [Amphiura filiformis]|uniref:egg peptide speract receptor-like n=1 Tax=Amphiura filiformis TaxID=82378 RepID=UPI003B21B55F